MEEITDTEIRTLTKWLTLIGVIKNKIVKYKNANGMLNVFREWYLLSSTFIEYVYKLLLDLSILFVAWSR